MELRLLEDRSGWAGLPGDQTLRFFDPVTGKFLRSAEEAEAALWRMEARATAAEAALQAARQSGKPAS